MKKNNIGTIFPIRMSQNKKKAEKESDVLKNKLKEVKDYTNRPHRYNILNAINNYLLLLRGSK